MVTRVGHIGMQVADLERSVKHAEEIMGLRVSRDDGDVVYLTANDRHHELVLRRGAEAGCTHLAFEVPDAATLGTVLDRATEAGYEVLGELPEPIGVTGAARFVGPGGFVIEIFHGMRLDQPAHYGTIGIRPVKFEHITVKSSRKDEFEAMLDRVLGFRLSDRADDAISWWRCCPEHHGVSVIRADVDQLQHYAWQIDSWEDIRRLGDRLMRRDKTFLWGPGHHGIGDNYFCYFVDEDEVIVEYSALIHRIDNEQAYKARTWPDEPLSVNKWGNPPPPPRFVEGGTPLVASDVAIGGVS